MKVLPLWVVSQSSPTTRVILIADGIFECVLFYGSDFVHVFMLISVCFCKHVTGAVWWEEAHDWLWQEQRAAWGRQNHTCSTAYLTYISTYSGSIVLPLAFKSSVYIQEKQNLLIMYVHFRSWIIHRTSWKTGAWADNKVQSTHSLAENKVSLI